MYLVEVARKSAVSLPDIPTWLGTVYIYKLKRNAFILRIREIEMELIAQNDDWESEKIRQNNILIDMIHE